jgi:hypothetical protein
MHWTDQLKAFPIDWLLELEDPAIRYRTQRDLLGAGEAELAPLRKEAHAEGMIPFVLSKMSPQGYWEKPGPGYGPKYKSTVWSLQSLAQMGASIEDERVSKACQYFMDQAFTQSGHITYNGAPGGTFDCLQGNMLWALTEMGWWDERIEMAYEWMARTITGEGLAPRTEKKATERYYAYKCGPNFACGANGNLPCGWGAVKVMRAFGNCPSGKRTPLIDSAIQAGIEFLLSVDPAQANYPVGEGQHQSQNWEKFGFPVFYISDVLQTAEALTGLGVTRDPRMQNLITLIHEKSDEQGRWNTQYSYGSKAWGNFGRLNSPSKWVTLRALRVLKAVG